MTGRAQEEAQEAGSILIVDDDAQYLKLLEALLKPAGVRVRFATSGAEALEILREPGVAVMVTDYHMPGVNGLQLACLARQILPELPIIMNTGACSPEVEEEAARAGILKVCHKPFEMEQLSGVLSGPGKRGLIRSG